MVSEEVEGWRGEGNGERGRGGMKEMVSEEEEG